MPAYVRARLVLVVAMLVTLLAAALLLFVLPGLPFAVISVPLDVFVNDTALLVGLAVIWLALLRYRERGDTASAVIAAAFMVSAGLNLLTITAEASGLGGRLGMSLAEPTQEPLFLHGVARLIMSATLFGGGLAVAGRWRAPAGWWWLLAPFVLALGVGGVIHVWGPSLPDWIGAGGLEQLMQQQTGEPLGPVTPLATAVQLTSAGLFLGAAVLYAGWRPQPPSPLPAFLAVAFLLGAASEVQFLIYPGSYSGVVGSNDIVRLGFATVLVLGIAADLRSTSHALSVAEVELRRLREAELAAAATTERARLAREIHDGLSQHLWLASLRIEELRGLPASGQVQSLVGDVASLVATGLEEAQQTIAALRDAGTQLPLPATIRTYAETFTRQRGIPIDLEMDPAVEDVPPRLAAELLRVVQEALSNTARHADATRVGLRVSRRERGLSLELRDNGVGFVPEASPGAGFGITSMRERVEGIGGTFSLRSAPSEGTVIGVEVPLGE